MNTINSATDVAPENYSDTVYQVVDGEKPKPKYIHAIKVYGDDDKEAVASGMVGLVHGHVLVDLEDPTTVGTVCAYVPSDLRTPDIFPTKCKSPANWMRSYETPLETLAVAAWTMVEREVLPKYTMYTDTVVAGVGQSFALEKDANKVLNAIKVMLGGYFGGFFLLQLLGWIKKKLFAKIHQLNPPHPVSVDAKLSDIRIHGLKGVFDSRNFNRYYVGASSENDYVPMKVLDALSRTFPHRPIARVSILRDGKIEHQPLFRHDITMDADTLVGDMLSVKAIIALALSMNMDQADCPSAKVVVEFCADKSQYSASASIKAGEISVDTVSCEQAGALSPHGMIETRKTLKDIMLAQFVNSLKTNGLYTHKRHTSSVILPYNVAKSLASFLSKLDTEYRFKLNSANDTGMEILVLNPTDKASGQLAGFITDRSVGADDTIKQIFTAEECASLDTDAILQGEEPVVVLGTNPILSYASASRRDEYLTRFIAEVAKTGSRIIYRSNVFGVDRIFITVEIESITEPLAQRKLSIDFSMHVDKSFSADKLDNFRAVGASRYVSRNPTSISFQVIPESDSVRIRYAFLGKDIELATELLFTILQCSSAKE